MHYKNLILIGSSHVSKDSINEVKRTIETEKPGIVAVELDKDRLTALLHKKKRGLFVRGVGFKGAVFAALGAWIEKKIGQVVKVEPGSEMKMAIVMAKKQNASVALIDQHINITLRRFSQTITWKEKWHFLVDLVLGVIMPKRQMKEMNLKQTDMYGVPPKETIKRILLFVKKRYPNVYNVLVHERNIVMANNLAHLMRQYPDKKIVAVVGAGHEDEMMKLIKEKLYKHGDA
jgi:pheromone shutdown-related protein TraB